MDFSRMPSVSKILNLMIFLSLLACSLYFMREIYQKYEAKETSMITSKKPRKEYQTTTICFSPHVKPSFLQKFNITNLSELDKKENIGFDWNTVLNEAFYELGKDFKLYHHVGNTEYKEGLNEFSGKQVIVDKLVTYLHGKCYRVLTNSLKYARGMVVAFDDTLAKEDIPKVDIYMTSENNSFGIIWAFWGEGRPLRFLLTQSVTTFLLEDREILHLEDTSDCTYETFHHHASRLIMENLLKHKENCSTNLCSPISIYGKNVSFCKSIESHFCMLRAIRWPIILAKEIRKDPCIVKEYNGITRPLGPNFTSYNGQKISRVRWVIDYEFKNVLTKKEYLVYDTIGLISNVGGLLGLFIGFSFLGITTDLVEYLGPKIKQIYDRALNE